MGRKYSSFMFHLSSVEEENRNRRRGGGFGWWWGGGWKTGWFGRERCVVVVVVALLRLSKLEGRHFILKDLFQANLVKRKTLPVK